MEVRNYFEILTYRERGPQYPFDRRVGGPQSQSARYGLEKNLFPLLGMISNSIEVQPKA
jgi:hypothetical protein